MKKQGLCLFALCIGLLNSVAFAQAVLPSSGVIDPSRLGAELSAKPSIPKPRADVALPETKKVSTPDQYAKIKFKLKQITVTGNQVLTDEEIAETYQKYVNTNISLADVFAIRQAIVALYREKGYILVKVALPEQSFDSKAARIRLEIIEGHVDKVNVTGDMNRLTRLLVEGYANQVTLSKPLKLEDMERYALLANDIHGWSVRFILSPSDDVKGGADLTVVTEREKKVDLSFSYDNFGTILLGPEQGGGTAYFNTPGFTSGRFGFRNVTTFDADRLNYYQFIYNQPFNRYGTTFNAYASLTKTFPGAQLLLFDIHSQSTNLIFTLSHPVIRSRKKNLYANLDFDVTNNMSDARAVLLNLYNDRIRSVRFGLVYDEIRGKGSTLLAARASQGLDIFGARLVGTPTEPLSRPNGDGQYFKLEGDIARTQFVGEYLSFYAAGHGQWADDPLLSAEQIGFGGPVYGRGFDPSEIIGDYGVDGKAEVRLSFEPDLNAMKKVQFFGFYDAGVVYNKDRTNFVPRLSATSAGGGIRTTLYKYLYVETYAAKPLTRGIATRGFDKDTRWMLNLILTN